MEYLKDILNRDNFNDFPQMKNFFLDYSKKLKNYNKEKFEYFLKESSINYKTREQFTFEANEKIRKIEEVFRRQLAINSIDDELSIKKIFLFTNIYTDNSLGLFLKEESAKNIVKKNPLYRVLLDIGQEKYDHYLENNPILLMAIGRFSEDSNWNNKTKKLLKDLTVEDFETREIDLVIVDVKIFKKSAQKIIKKKNFNTHDKILGVHIVSTLDYDVFNGNKAPILRTITKMIHYHKEIMIFNRSIKDIAKNYKIIFSQLLFELLESHVYKEDDNLFNTNDVLEGLANRYVDTKIKEIAKDYPQLKLWADVHNVTYIVRDEKIEEISTEYSELKILNKNKKINLNNKIVSLSLWRLTSWNISNSNQHTLQMYRDNIVADMLIEYFDEKLVEDGVNLSLIDRDNNVFNSIKRIKHINDFYDIPKLTAKEVVVLHHNDADGLSSGFIVNNTLIKLGIKVYRYSLEIMFPKAIDIILKQYKDIPIFIVDLGTEIIHHIMKSKEKRNFYFIDHHNYKKLDTFPENYYILNPRKHDIAADYEGASSINAYFFYQSQLNYSEYAVHGLLGAIGDGMYARNKNSFKGIDALVYNKARTKDLYINNIDTKPMIINDFVKNELNIIGSVGYHSSGINLAFELMDMKIQISDPRIKALKNSKKLKYQRTITYLIEKGFDKGKYYYSFKIDKWFHPMGLKEIGNFLEYILANSDILGEKLLNDKFYFGVQLVMPVKAIGEVVDKESYKLSMRVGKDLIPLIKEKKYPDLFEISNSFENIPGGIHSLSAAVIIEKDKYKKVLEEIDQFIDEFVKSRS